MDLKELGTLIKRFFSLQNHWYGDLVIKFQAGEIVNVKANTSYDMEILKNQKLNNTQHDSKIRNKESKSEG